MAYADELAKLNRTKITLVEVDLDFCGLDYNVGLCTPDLGLPVCYKTYKTCVMLQAFSSPPLYKTEFAPNKITKTYRFTSADQPVPGNGYRPYLKSYNLLTQEIKDNITVKNRVSIEFYDDNNESDIDNDPYRSGRGHSSIIVNGSYFKRLFARNPSYKYRSVRIYEGFTQDGILLDTWQLRFSGKMENVLFDKSIVKLECIDDLKFLDESVLSTSLDGTLAVDIDHTQTTGIYVTSTSGMAASGYLAIEDEIIHYTSLSSTLLVTVTRGMFGTIKANHKMDTKLIRVYHYAGNPFDVIEDIFIDAGVGYDTAALAELSGNYIYSGEPNVFALITSDTKRSELLWELVEQMGCRVWMNEEGYATIRRNFFYSTWAVQPTYISGQQSISDDLNIIDGSCSIDWNEKNRYSRINFYSDLKIYNSKRALSAGISNSVTTIPVTSVEDLPDRGEVIIGTEFIRYSGLDLSGLNLTGCVRGERSTTAASHSSGDAVYQGDLTALKEVKDSKSYYNCTITYDENVETDVGTMIPKTIYSRWFNSFASYYPITTTGYLTYITDLCVKMLDTIKEARQRLSLELEIKDEGIKLGDFVKITTDEFNYVDATDFDEEQFQIVKKDLSETNKIKYIAEHVLTLD